MKQFNKQIANCLQCPNRETDANVTRYLCGAPGVVNGRMIGWMSEVDDKVEAGEFALPQWCPLPEAETDGVIEQCAQIATKIKENALVLVNQAAADSDAAEWHRQSGRGLAATVIEQKIRAFKGGN